MSPKAPFTLYHEKLAAYAKALSHPVRIFILESLLREQELLSGDLAKQLPIARSTLSQHIKDLKDAGLLQWKEDPPRIIYTINKKNWEEAKLMLHTFFT